MLSHSLLSRDLLLGSADQWDDLHTRSRITLPTCRARCVGQWLTAFAPAAPFHCPAVRLDGRLVAALPLFGRKLARVVPSLALPSNDWGLCGDLLLDESTGQTNAVLDELAAGLRKVPAPLVELNDALLDEPRWQALTAALDRAGLAWISETRLEIARLDVTGTWSEYLARLSRNHRGKLARQVRRLAAEGDVALEWHEQFSPESLEPLLRRGFALEQQGWKGQQQTAILDQQAISGFLLDQAGELASLGMLRVAFLRLGERDVAFHYGWANRGVQYLFKIAYNETFARYSPGQLLLARLLERAMHDPQIQAVDFLSPLVPAVASWRPATYRVGRIWVAPRSGALLWLLRTQTALARSYRRWFTRSEQTDSHASTCG